MRVGDLVKVNVGRSRERVLGLVLEVHRDKFNCVAVVQPVKPGRQIVTNPINIEVINARG